MARGDLIEIQRRNGDGEWDRYGRVRLIQANKTKSREIVAASRESSAQSVTFRVAWHRQLEAIEHDTDCFRILWRGVMWDIQGYDDYMYQHVTVDLEAVSYG